MTDVAEMVAVSVERGKLEILADVGRGVVPADVRDFSTLHDFVDANEYGGLCEDGHGLSDEEWRQWGVDVQDALNVWLAGGRV